MDLPQPALRRHMHTRTIHCEGFRRDDGLWDIEARIIDMKTFAYREPIRGDRGAGDHVHNMIVRLTITDDLVVRDVQVAMPATPYPTCLQAMPAYQGLIGKRIGQGWRRAVQECVGGTKGCTHVRELLFPMATVAFQTVIGWRESDGNGSVDDGATIPPAHTDDTELPHFIDGCKGWARNGEVVAKLYPRFHRPDPVSAPSAAAVLDGPPAGARHS